MARKPLESSIYRVAEHLGVSIATVSRVVNNRVGVSEETRRTVLEYIRRVGYQASCGNARPKYVAIINFYPAPTEYNRKLLETLFLHFRTSNAIFCSALYYDFQNEPQTLLRRLRDEQYSGAILITPPPEFFPQLADFCNSDIPVMLIDHGDDTLPSQFGYICHNSRQAAASAVRYLAELGHRHIAYLGANPGIPGADAYSDGYCDGMKAAGLTPLPAINNRSGNLEEIACEESTALLQAHPKLTAILAKDDDYALGTMRAASQLGLRVPEDLSIIGCGDYNFSAYCIPSLTTLAQDFDYLGEVIASTFAKCLTKQTFSSALPRIFVSSRLLVRESTAAPRPSGRHTE